MPQSPRARVVAKDLTRWSPAHANFTQRMQGLYDVWPPETRDLLAAYRGTSAALQGLIAKAVRERTTLRGFGAAWSFSRAVATEGYLVNTKPLNLSFNVTAGKLHAAYPGTKDDLFFAQCGVSVAQLNDMLAAKGRSLKTSGASNGQTIVGAMSTGTHGAALSFGSVQDYVVGLNLVLGPGRDVWLERASYPVTRPSFARAIGAELIRDDTLFNAALVSFGSFGFIHGVMLETEKLYLLNAHRQRLPWNPKLRDLLDTLRFKDSELPGGSRRPYHFEVVINPHDLRGGVYVTSMYKRPYKPDYPRPQREAGGLGPGDDAIVFLGLVSDLFPSLRPKLMTVLLEKMYKTYSDKWGTSGEIFSHTDARGRSLTTALGVSLSDVNTVVDLLLRLNRRHGPFPGVFSLRYVKGTDALLGFTRFPNTCVIEVDGPQARNTRDFQKRVWRELEAAGIPYTFHWGKIEGYNAANVRRMYGQDRVDAWLDSRRALMRDSWARAFNNPFLKRCGLDA